MNTFTHAVTWACALFLCCALFRTQGNAIASFSSAAILILLALSYADDEESRW